MISVCAQSQCCVLQAIACRTSVVGSRIGPQKFGCGAWCQLKDIDILKRRWQYRWQQHRSAHVVTVCHSKPDEVLSLDLGIVSKGPSGKSFINVFVVTANNVNNSYTVNNRSNEYRIKQAILLGYDRTSRPVRNDNTTVNVSINIALYLLVTVSWLQAQLASCLINAQSLPAHRPAADNSLMQCPFRWQLMPISVLVWCVLLLNQIYLKTMYRSTISFRFIWSICSGN